jgi:hypothetical protein
VVHTPSVLNKDQPHGYWTVATTWIRLAETAEFASLTNRLARALEHDFDGDVVLWFAGYPVTGQRRKAFAAEAGEVEPRGEFRMVWNLRDRSMDDAVGKWITKASEPWVKKWRQLLHPMEKTTVHDSFVTPAFSGSPPDVFDLREAAVAWKAEPAKADDLYVVGTDERIFRVPKGRYARPESESQTALEMVEFQLAREILESGAQVSSIPSIGLPIRGSFCYIVRLSDH